jgi:MFS family permease
MPAHPVNQTQPQGWIGPLVAIMTLQGAGAFLVQVVPVLAPMLGPALGWPTSAVGYLAATTMFGSMVFLLFGVRFMRARGPIRSVQIGLALGMGGLVCLALPTLAAAAVASLLIGLAYGTPMPAGSQILQRYAPARHRSLVFSIKQAGVPMGAALAGAMLPPVAIIFGWPAALLLAGGLVGLCVIAVQRLRRRVDGEAVAEAGERQVATRGLAALTEPLAALRLSPGLPRLALAGGCLAANQGSWTAFLVTWLVQVGGYSLAQAGLFFAVMQGAAIAGRLTLGFIADRAGSALRIIQACAVASGLVAVLIVFAASQAPSAAVAGLMILAGVGITGWNGIHLAELAQRAPHDKVAEVAAGATVFVMIGLMAGPFLTASLIALTGSFTVAFLCVAALPLSGALLLASVPGPRPQAQSAPL